MKKKNSAFQYGRISGQVGAGLESARDTRAGRRCVAAAHVGRRQEALARSFWKRAHNGGCRFDGAQDLVGINGCTLPRQAAQCGMQRAVCVVTAVVRSLCYAQVLGEEDDGKRANKRGRVEGPSSSSSSSSTAATANRPF